jgi:hypothetical protein
MDERDAAARDLARIRTLMERAGRYSNLSGYSAILAGLLAVGGAVACKLTGTNFNDPSQARPLAVIWGSVLGLAILQHLAFTIVHARQAAEPAWSPLVQQVVLAVLPAFFVGATITGYGLQTGQLDLLPPIWMLAHGSTLMALGLYAGKRFQVVGALFLLLGALGLWYWKEYGLRLMLASFGGLHVLLGAWMRWKPRP